MTDKEILEEVYQQMTRSDLTHLDKKDFRKFIEQEWQKRDDQERVDQFNRNREVKDHVSTVVEMDAKISDWYAWQDIGIDPDPCTNDVKEIERHRALEIGEDGTVKKIL